MSSNRVSVVPFCFFPDERGLCFLLGVERLGTESVFSDFYKFSSIPATPKARIAADALWECTQGLMGPKKFVDVFSKDLKAKSKSSGASVYALELDPAFAEWLVVGHTGLIKYWTYAVKSMPTECPHLLNRMSALKWIPHANLLASLQNLPFVEGKHVHLTPDSRDSLWSLLGTFAFDVAAESISRRVVVDKRPHSETCASSGD